MNISVKDTVIDRVQGAVAEALVIDRSAVKLESAFAEDLGADSLDIATLLMILEDELGLQINEEKARTLRTVGDVVELALQMKQGA